MGRATVWKHLWGFFTEGKKWYLAPLIVMLLAFGFFIVFTEASVLAPFIYALF